MGFWESVGKMVGSAVNEVKEAGDRAKLYKLEMADKSDNDLAYIIKSERATSPLKASAAFQELKSRGYTQEDINLLVRYI